jgi:hypothetical protein
MSKCETAREFADMSPQQRFEDQQRRTDEITGTYRAPERKPGVRVDQATYDKFTNRQKVEYAQEFQPKPGSDPNAPADPAAPPAPDPNAERFKIGDVEATETEWRDALSFKAAEDAKRLSLPQTPDGYKLELPKDLKLPEGVSFEFRPDDPIRGPALASLREFAKANSWTQEQLSGLLGIYAGSIAHESKMISDGAKAQRDLLGAAGGARVDAVSRWLKAEVGDDLARPLLQTMVMEKQVRAYETMIQKKTGQGAGSFRQTGRDVNDGRIDQATYDKMSYGERKDYAEKFSGPGNSRRGG